MSVFPQQSCCSCLSCTAVCVAVSCCLSVLCDGTAGRRSKPTGPSVSHIEQRICFSWTCCLFAPVFMWVYEKVCMHECSQITQICQQSALLNLEHTFCSCGLTQTRPPLLLPPRSPLLTPSYILLIFGLTPCLLLAPFLLLTSSQPSSIFLFSCHLPPTTTTLLLLSRPSWGAQ